MNRINICFITDEGYCIQTSVALISMLKNKNMDSIYDVYILCSNVSEDKKNKFMQMNSKNFNIKIIDLCENEEYKKYDIKDIPASITAMYKFSLPNILNLLDKVLYLDGDIIVKKDLTDLFNYDIGDNYVGAIKEAGGLSKTLFSLYSKNNLFYFNSGVMLLNLKKMRKNNVTEKLIDYRINGYNELMDQDSLNYVLRDKACELPFKYNTQLVFAYITKNFEKIKKVCLLEENINSVSKILENAVIVHYSGMKKPWKHFDGFAHDLWVYYYYLSPFKDKILIRDKYCPKNKENKIINFIQRKKKNIRRYRFMKKFKKK